MTIYDSGERPAIGGTRAAAGFSLVDLPGGRAQVRGSWDECTRVITTARRSGRLVGAAPIRPDGAGGYLLTLQLSPPPRLLAETRLQPWWREQPGLAVAFLVVVLFLAGLAAWAVSVVLPVIPELLKIIAVGGLLASAGWFLLGQVKLCPGVHCPGCKCGKG